MTAEIFGRGEVLSAAGDVTGRSLVFLLVASGGFKLVLLMDVLFRCGYLLEASSGREFPRAVRAGIVDHRR